MWDNNCNSLISEAKVQIYKVRMGDDGDFDIDAMLEAPYEKEVNLATLGNVLMIVMLCICIIRVMSSITIQSFFWSQT